MKIKLLYLLVYVIASILFGDTKQEMFNVLIVSLLIQIYFSGGKNGIQ